jgi:hypothetical protein
MVQFVISTTLVLLSSSLSHAQTTTNNASPNILTAAVKGDLKLIIIGSEIMSSGRRGGFRVYAAPDGTKAWVSYASFETVQDANRQTQLWLKLADKTLLAASRKDSSGKLTETRTITQGRGTESGRKLFMIIKRNGMNCYFVRSSSLAVAMQIEDLIQN